MNGWTKYGTYHSPSYSIIYHNISLGIFLRNPKLDIIDTLLHIETPYCFRHTHTRCITQSYINSTWYTQTQFFMWWKKQCHVHQPWLGTVFTYHLFHVMSWWLGDGAFISPLWKFSPPFLRVASGMIFSRWMGWFCSTNQSSIWEIHY